MAPTLGCPSMATRIGPGVLEIDTLLGGWTRMTAGYLVEGPAPTLVETGSQSSVPTLLAALSVLAPPVGVIGLLLLGWLLLAGRRREGQKYAGLRILR